MVLAVIKPLNFKINDIILNSKKRKIMNIELIKERVSDMEESEEFIALLEGVA